MTTTNEHTERAELIEALRAEAKSLRANAALFRLQPFPEGQLLQEKAADMLEAQRSALKPLTDEKLQGLYRYRLRANGVNSDPWYWYTSGSADTEAAHGIKEQA